jgi:hypothetical protein
MSGVTAEQGSTMSIVVTNTSISKQNLALHNVPPPTFPEDGGKFNSSYSGLFRAENMSLGEPLTLAEALTASNPSLEVSVFIKEMKIYRNDQIVQDARIKFDMLLLIPMELQVSNEAPDVTATVDKKLVKIKNEYVTIDLGDTFKKDLWEGDLFGRKEGEDSPLKMIERLTIGIFKPIINIIDQNKLAVLVTTGGTSQIMEFKDNSSISFKTDSGEIKSPQFNIILKKDTNQNYGSFRVLRVDNAIPSFDFKLYVQAKIKLEQDVIGGK